MMRSLLLHSLALSIAVHSVAGTIWSVNVEMASDAELQTIYNYREIYGIVHDLVGHGRCSFKDKPSRLYNIHHELHIAGMNEVGITTFMSEVGRQMKLRRLIKADLSSAFYPLEENPVGNVIDADLMSWLRPDLAGTRYREFLNLDEVNFLKLIRHNSLWVPNVQFLKKLVDMWIEVDPPTRNLRKYVYDALLDDHYTNLWSPETMQISLAFPSKIHIAYLNTRTQFMSTLELPKPKDVKFVEYCRNQLIAFSKDDKARWTFRTFHFWQWIWGAKPQFLRLPESGQEPVSITCDGDGLLTQFTDFSLWYFTMDGGFVQSSFQLPNSVVSRLQHPTTMRFYGDSLWFAMNNRISNIDERNVLLKAKVPQEVVGLQQELDVEEFEIAGDLKIEHLKEIKDGNLTFYDSLTGTINVYSIDKETHVVCTKPEIRGFSSQHSIEAHHLHAQDMVFKSKDNLIFWNPQKERMVYSVIRSDDAPPELSYEDLVGLNHPYASTASELPRQ